MIMTVNQVPLKLTEAQEKRYENHVYGKSYRQLQALVRPFHSSSFNYRAMDKDDYLEYVRLLVSKNII